MSDRFARRFLALQVLLLLVGTLMPGAWRGSVEHAVASSLPLSSLAHFVMFAGMALVLAARPLAWRVARIVLAALALALLSEGLQFFAIDRHPRWVDVGIDLAGALAGIGLIKLGVLCFTRR